jgi:hypothetical protein
MVPFCIVVCELRSVLKECSGSLSVYQGFSVLWGLSVYMKFICVQEVYLCWEFICIMGVHQFGREGYMCTGSLSVLGVYLYHGCVCVCMCVCVC